MSEAKDKEKKTLSLGEKGTLNLKGPVGAPPPRQNVTQGRGKTVAVEVRRKRTQTPSPTPQQQTPDTPESDSGAAPQVAKLRTLTEEERKARIQALHQAEEDAKIKKEEDAAKTKPTETAKQVKKAPSEEEKQRQQELEELQKIEASEALLRKEQGETAPSPTEQPHQKDKRDIFAADEEEEESYRARMKRNQQRPTRRAPDQRRRSGKLTVTQVLNEDYARERGPSLAAQRRAREKARMNAQNAAEPQKMSREIIVPEVITVQELANRMAERSVDLIKALMKMDVMAMVNDTIDPDTAELIVHEFGHTIKRVTEGDVEGGLEGEEDRLEDTKPRPPVVTVMGHVDHGKTSLLDALRKTDVVAGEAGGITQHIGAYQVTMKNGSKITFLDTPGHAAFTEMRARGANVTDIVVLVVAANDSIMPQTIEAIHHAKAASVPVIVAINKIDLPDANPQKVRQDLLSHEIIPEEMGGDVLCIDVSAKEKLNLDKLEETILLQSEMLDLRANPDRPADGTIIESKLEQGRGNVATVLIQRGTLRIGDLFVAGTAWGRIRALLDDRGANIEEAEPGKPVEVLGLNSAPQAGDKLFVIEDEARARDITEYRQRKRRDKASALAAGTPETFEDFLAQDQERKKKALNLVIRGDVNGSVEAIIGSLNKIVEENEDVKIQVLHSGVGGITESDVILAKASNALIVGFNVRANTQARLLAEKEGQDIRYYNVIYNLIDDAKAVLTGLLAPTIREEYLGQAKIQQVFNITKVGKIAGCVIEMGMVKRGAKVRLLRDDVVIHEGTLKTLKRHKDEVKEVKEGTECGMAFESYDDIKDNDVIECYEMVEEARTLE